MSLVVCWRRPERDIPAGAPVLSFLPPADEERVAGTTGAGLIRARAVSSELRRRARETYLGIVAAIGTARSSEGPLFREAVGGRDGLSLWWLHPVSYKDCESDRLFERVIAIETIRDAAATRGAREIELWGAPPGVAQALSSRYEVRSFAEERSAIGPWWLLRALAARTAFGVKTALRVLRARNAPVPDRLDVAILGFWDWSVWPADGRLRDRYLGSAPQSLAEGLKVGWLVWPDPEGRAASGPVAPVPSDGSAALLTRWLGLGDVLRACLDLSAFSCWRRWRSTPETRRAFLRDGIDYLPVFDERLLRGFADASTPRSGLIGLAVGRATSALGVRVLVSFLETHPVARAAFAAARSASPATKAAAVQHASLAPEKTFYFYDSSERSGPMPVPTADLACAAGGLGAEVFNAQGCWKVETTGTPRYDWLRSGSDRPSRAEGPWRIVIACGLDSPAESEMVEAAVLASDGAPVELIVRDHPFSRTSLEPRLAGLRGRFAVSDRPLAEDLGRADLVLFTYSTVGEEAVMSGVPAWQWRRLGPDMSALSSEAAIPRFDSVAQLAAALRSFAPGQGLPGADERRRLESRLFHHLDGQSGPRVAAAIKSLF